MTLINLFLVPTYIFQTNDMNIFSTLGEV
uniref:Uncharacterized protein n=1 Tax=Arundo donax TaxID=35708 RepID=A0A0A9ACP8_ARUDO